MRSPRPARRILVSLIAVFLGLLLVEGLLSLFWLARDYRAFRSSLPVAVPFLEEHHSEHDPELGWVNVPAVRLVDFYGPGRTLTINEDGFRGLLENLRVKPAETFRLVCLGDSFTLGYGVDDTHTYPAQIEVLNGGVQAVNMGQGGYSVGQCYLWYEREASRLEADGVVFAFILDDLWRMSENRLSNGAAMPRFELDAGELRVSGQPVPRQIAAGEPIQDGRLLDYLSEHSALCRTVGSLTGQVRGRIVEGRREDQVGVALAILEALHRETAMQRVPLAVVLLPELGELASAQAAEMHQRVSHSVRQTCLALGIPFLDLFNAFARRGADGFQELYLAEQWNHFSEAGNRLAAERIDAFLRNRMPGYPGGPAPND